MNVFTISNRGFSRLTRNLVASARRVGLDVAVYVPSDDQRIPGLSCVTLQYERMPSTEQNARMVDGFSRSMEFKMEVIKRNLSQKRIPLLYLDADSAVLRDPAPFLHSVKSPLAFQDRACAPWGPSYCAGMIFVKQYQPWIELLFHATPKDLVGTQDEMLLNLRIDLLHGSAKSRIEKLPHPQFMLGYFTPTADTIIYHANFTQLHGETGGVEESKIAKLRDSGAWFLNDGDGDA